MKIKKGCQPCSKVAENFLRSPKSPVIRAQGISYLKNDAHFVLRILLNSTLRKILPEIDKTSEIIPLLSEKYSYFSPFTMYLKQIFNIKLSEREQKIIKSLKPEDVKELVEGMVFRLFDILLKKPPQTSSPFLLMIFSGQMNHLLKYSQTLSK